MELNITIYIILLFSFFSNSMHLTNMPREVSNLDINPKQTNNKKFGNLNYKLKGKWKYLKNLESQYGNT